MCVHLDLNNATIDLASPYTKTHILIYIFTTTPPTAYPKPDDQLHILRGTLLRFVFNIILSSTSNIPRS